MLAVAAGLGHASIATAAEFSLIAPDTLRLAGDVRLVGVGGERSWTEGDFGKLRFGGGSDEGRGDFRLLPRLGEGDLIWQPRFGWALSGTVVGLVQDKGKLEAGLSEAYLGWKPLTGGKVKLSARAGLMYPPVSLEHSGPEWAVTETITPSAINSWIGEEVKVVGLEGALAWSPGAQRITATAAIFDVNDTAGALLTFRGWALDDVKALAFKTHPLPELDEEIEYSQPRFTHPVKDIDPGILKRPGYYAKIAWQLPSAVRVDAFHYDNNGDPEQVNDVGEWGWRTTFNNIGVVADLGPATQLRAQALSGRTRMGLSDSGKIWIDNRFRSAFALVTRRFGRGALSGRIEAFDTRNRGSIIAADDDEQGWAATIAGHRSLGPRAALFVEALHVESRRDARRRDGLAPHQPQTQIQAAFRAAW